ncbi:MAG: hypothetical protein IIB46_03700 [Nitrospinae bacterium]|nr:hypothetical protein [Nitrospinota bacterium]
MIRKPEIRNRGHWLAQIMLGGPGRKESKLGYGPLFTGGRKSNTRQMREPKSAEIEKND